jgi:hypothetical protein
MDCSFMNFWVRRDDDSENWQPTLWIFFFPGYISSDCNYCFLPPHQRAIHCRHGRRRNTFQWFHQHTQ